MVVYTTCDTDERNRRTYGDDDQEEFIREGFDPQHLKPSSSSEVVTEDNEDTDEDGGPNHSKQTDGNDQSQKSQHGQTSYGSSGEGNVWDRHD